jgi:hypothetical protein
MCNDPVLGSQRHETGHLVLGQLDLLPTERGQGQIGDAEVLGVGERGGDGHGVSRARVEREASTRSRPP